MAVTVQGIEVGDDEQSGYGGPVVTVTVLLSEPARWIPGVWLALTHLLHARGRRQCVVIVLPLERKASPRLLIECYPKAMTQDCKALKVELQDCLNEVAPGQD